MDSETKKLIDSILEAKGSKSYEELLKEAETIKEANEKNSKVAKTSDTSHVSVYASVVVLMSMIITCILVLRRKHS